MSTRYSNKGINTISDVEIFHNKITKKTNQKKIYHIRLETKALPALKKFVEDILPFIDSPFILISTGEDITIPNQIDPRWPELKDIIKKYWQIIIENEFLIHWFIENRDAYHKKTSSLPIGINPREMPSNNVDYILKYMHNIPIISNRPLKIICIHRKREGDRMKINNLLKQKKLKEHCICSSVLFKDEWWKTLQKYPFVICAHGGGLDPSPKVWEALCVGCIPIIKHSSLDDIYDNFPVVYVNEWNEEIFDSEILKKWLNDLSKYFDDKNLYNQWKHKLFTKYWKTLINNKLL